MSDISIIKLMNGSTIVGKLSIDGDIIEIEHPIELITTQFQQEGVGVGEQVHLRPWVSIAEEDIFGVERYNIISMASLQENIKATAIYTIALADLWYVQTNVRTYGNPGTGTGGQKANYICSSHQCHKKRGRAKLESYIPTNHKPFSIRIAGTTQKDIFP